MVIATALIAISPLLLKLPSRIGLPSDPPQDCECPGNWQGPFTDSDFTGLEYGTTWRHVYNDSCTEVVSLSQVTKDVPCGERYSAYVDCSTLPWTGGYAGTVVNGTDPFPTTQISHGPTTVGKCEELTVKYYLIETSGDQYFECVDSNYVVLKTRTRWHKKYQLGDPAVRETRVAICTCIDEEPPQFPPEPLTS